jgi:DNA-nicking Smr family endonuclease
MPRRQPSEEERALWLKATETVEPARRRKPAPTPAAPEPVTAPAPKVQPQPRPKPAPPPAPLPKLTSSSTPGLDKRTAERLKRGQLAIEARLDLHGMTQEEAHRALTRFIAAGHRSGRRAVLVITGKGVRLDGEQREAGVLRRMVPRWLNEAPTRGLVLAFSAARAKDGGGGALYVLLRRQRP